MRESRVPYNGRRMKRVLRWMMRIAAVGLLGIAAFGFSFYVAMKVEMRSTQVSVPDLAGLTQEQAAQLARPLDLLVDVIDRRHDPAVSSGQILQQEPVAGASVRRGRKIKVVLSLGGRVLRVPALHGRGARAAEIELNREGFATGTEARVQSEQGEVGSILAQVPPAESPAVPGTRISLLVSDGAAPRRWVMPDLVGRASDDVEKWIERSGFRRGPVRQVSVPGKGPGIVLGQSPLSGYPVAQRAVVELTVTR